MSLLIMIGFGLIVPSLPQFVRSLGAGEAGVGVVLFAFSLTRLLGDFFAGALIDQFGERTITAAGAAIVGLSSIAAGAARTFSQLVVLRGLGGFGSAFFLGGLMAYLVGTTLPSERGRAMGMFQASFGMGFLIGPAVGGLMIAFTPVNYPLYVYGAVCLLCVPLVLRALGGEHIPAEALTEAPDVGDETMPASRIPSWSRVGPLLGLSAYRGALAGCALLFKVSAAPQTLLPNFWRDALHQSKGSSGIPFAVTALFGLAVIWHAGSLSDRRGRKFALVPSVAVCAVAIGAVGLTHNAVAVIALMALVGAATGYMRPGPSAIVADLATPETRGAAVSGYRIAGDIGALLGPMLAGVVAQYVSFQAAFLAVGAVAALVFVVVALAEETLPSRQAA